VTPLQPEPTSDPWNTQGDETGPAARLGTSCLFRAFTSGEAARPLRRLVRL
jgi:hypothetical protein